MTDTYTDNSTDSFTSSGVATDSAAVEDPAAILTDGLNRLEELRSFHEQAVSDLEEGRADGRERIAALQAEIDAENAKLNDVVIEAATAFNEESARLIDTGWATPKVLASRGLATIRVPKKA
ncbi:hypothetical protein MMAG44476_27008 [Mycolicibacterium mageritense DSM 44476 = CIP 104973]|uniref:Uncharacterized protein n=1 Tax=Mycolicibacterium canariasense TaxID=228230 RepID=A0A100WI43_MYCCR|nr:MULTISPECIES: hypothetical protein [Mycolicibacterium]MCC9179423.1 hypothetical protein [Mycolicibacterium mageritense]GAS98721.1 uncharacterized protein RMCC_5686 [Mycolicibacterium canariasense]